MEDVLISIVIPVYNVEKYLKQCMDSILNCAKGPFEIVLIDDGSTDNSPTICDEYSKNHENIKAIHKKNCGVSSARNIGIQSAKGQYITFIDADDFVTKDYFDNLNEAIQKKTDICFFNYTRWVDEKTHDLGTQLVPPGIYKDLEIIYRKIADMEVSIMSVCCQVYKLDIIKANNILFDENMKTCEDFQFFLNYFEHVETAYVSAGASYCYRLNLYSATSMRNFSHIDDYEKIYEKLCSLLISKKLYIEVKKSFRRKWVRWMIDIAYNLYAQGEDKSCIKSKIRNTKIYKESTVEKYNRLQERMECYLLKNCLCVPISLYLKCLNFVKRKMKRVRL